jgi:hypothetical protein
MFSCFFYCCEDKGKGASAFRAYTVNLCHAQGKSHCHTGHHNHFTAAVPFLAALSVPAHICLQFFIGVRH